MVISITGVLLYAKVSPFIMYYGSALLLFTRKQARRNRSGRSGHDPTKNSGPLLNKNTGRVSPAVCWASFWPDQFSGQISGICSKVDISFSHAIGFCFDERSAALLSPRMRRSHRTTPLRLPARAICLLLFPTGRLSPCARSLELPASQTTQS